MIHDELVNKIVTELKKNSQIKAVVIGGSYATGTQRPDSDLDLGLFYDEYNPIGKEDIEKAITKLGGKDKTIISDIGEWGKWMNGGVWMIIDNQRIDFIYRNYQFVSKTIYECLEGKIDTDFYQQPAFGFYNYIYCAEIQLSRTLYDPENRVADLKQKVATYPNKLKTGVTNKFLWDAQFSLSRAQKSEKRNEVFIVAGCLVRIINDLVQILYALNDTFYFGEKKFYKDIDVIKIKPPDFLEKINKILTAYSVSHAENLLNEFLDLTKGRYVPK